MPYKEILKVRLIVVICTLYDVNGCRGCRSKHAEDCGLDKIFCKGVESVDYCQFPWSDPLRN